jgi:RHS repeat-associated protein
MDCDGDVDYDDIDALTLAITDPEEYAETYPDCVIELGDLNDDGEVDFDDIDYFSGILAGGWEGRTFVYDEENRLTRVARKDGSSSSLYLQEYKYDALGRRVETVDYTDSYEECGTADSLTRHVYSGIQCVEEHHWCIGSSTVWELSREFVWGERFPEPVAMVDWTAAGDVADGVEEIVHYIHDSLGNIVGLTDKGNPTAVPPVPGKLVERYAYDPYGKPYIQYWNSGTSTWQTKLRSEFNNPFLWTGQRYDAGGSSSTKSIGLYHFLFRSYSPELGRWMQRDPLGYVDGVGLYELTVSSPLANTDPLGLATFATKPGWFPVYTGVIIYLHDGRRLEFNPRTLEDLQVLLDALKGSIRKIYIYGHGSNATQLVGDDRDEVDDEAITEHNAGQVLGGARRGHIYLMGCKVGNGPGARAYLQAIANATGSCVTAYTGNTKTPLGDTPRCSYNTGWTITVCPNNNHGKSSSNEPSGRIDTGFPAPSTHIPIGADYPGGPKQ